MNRIHRLVVDGEELVVEQQIQQHLVDHFVNAFQKSRRWKPGWVDEGLRRLPEDLWAELKWLLSLAEVCKRGSPLLKRLFLVVRGVIPASLWTLWTFETLPLPCLLSTPRSAEFVIYKLKEMGKISQEDIAIVMEEFENLDVDHLGTLLVSDLLIAQSTE
ncbi:Two pore potassium channel a [Acorus calamus]|uniref:Two pore potassium channel a n=1 Tax=Acorus calamus TaxID=4465 RepID=A0AAV9DYY5_ACOCL|nr:Two pore potassium channel a [Acorus calamus]